MDNNKFNFSWFKTLGEFDVEDNQKKSLPIFYDFYSSNDFQNVYEPSDDTFLFIDLLNLFLPKYLNMFMNDNQKIFSVEFGVGNGLLSCTYLDYLNKTNTKINKHFCVDLNKDAVNLTKRLISNYHLTKENNDDNINDVEFIESDLFENLPTDLKFDFIFFNPPYVTTDREEYLLGLERKDIYASWAGGDYGSETIFKFIKALKGRMSENCIILLLLSMENKVKEIIQMFWDEYQYGYELLMKRKIMNEYLGIFKFQFKK